MTSPKLRLAATLLASAGIFSTTTALGYQFGGMMGTPPQASPARPTGNPKTAQERIALAQQALSFIDAGAKKGELPNWSDERLLWQERLVEAQIDAGQPKQVVVQDYLNALQAAEAAAKSRYEKGEITVLQLLEVKFRKVDAQKPLLDRATQPQAMGGMAGAMSGGFDGGVGGANLNDRPHKPRKQHPADLERNKVIEQKLESPIEMHFANETPLEDVIKYIKSALSEPKGKSIPIYVDPLGLQEVEKTMTSPVTLELEDVPLRTTLRLMLTQLGLDYRVRDGMVFIDAKSTFEEEEGADDVAPPASPATPGGVGGGFR